MSCKQIEEEIISVWVLFQGGERLGFGSRKVRIHSAPSLLVELGSEVAARGEPPRFTPSCCKATMLHAASLDGAVC
jgi:hypothetical protein